MRKDFGFTLIEMLVVLAVIAIMAAVAIPHMIAFRYNRALRNGADEILSAMQIARLGAIKENTNVIVSFNTGTNSFEVFVDNGEGGGVANNNNRDGTERIIKSGQMMNSVDMTSAAFTWGTKMRFTGRGISNGGGQVLLENTEDTDYKKRIIVNFAGSPRMEGSTDNGGTWS